MNDYDERTLQKVFTCLDNGIGEKILHVWNSISHNFDLLLAKSK